VRDRLHELERSAQHGHLAAGIVPRENRQLEMQHEGRRRMPRPVDGDPAVLLAIRRSLDTNRSRPPGPPQHYAHSHRRGNGHVEAYLVLERVRRVLPDDYLLAIDYGMQFARAVRKRRQGRPVCAPHPHGRDVVRQQSCRVRVAAAGYVVMRR